MTQFSFDFCNWPLPISCSESCGCVQRESAVTRTQLDKVFLDLRRKKKHLSLVARCIDVDSHPPSLGPNQIMTNKFSRNQKLIFKATTTHWKQLSGVATCPIPGGSIYCRRARTAVSRVGAWEYVTSAYGNGIKPPCRLSKLGQWRQTCGLWPELDDKRQEIESTARYHENHLLMLQRTC
jgi:hypothetical protein